MNHLATQAPDQSSVTPASAFDGRYYAEGFAVFKAPKKNAQSGGLSLGFKVCDVSDAVTAEQVAVCLNAAEQVESLFESLRTSTTMLEALLVQLNSWGHESAVNARDQIWKNEELLKAIEASL